MKELFLKLVFLFFSLYIILYLYLAFFPMYYNAVDNTRWYYFKQIFEKKITIEKSNILFFGDSRVNTNVDVKKIPNSWSFAAGGSSPVEMYYALKNYIRIYSKPDTVFVSFSPRSFIEAYSFWGYAIRNDYFNNKQFNEILKNSMKFPEDNVLGSFSYLNYLSYKANYIKHYQTDLYKNHVFLAKYKNIKIINHFQSEKGVWIYPNLKNGCSELNFESTLSSFNISALLNLYFVKLLDLCKEKNIYLIFEFMPMNKSSYQVLNTNFIREYREYIKSIANKYPNFIISDTIYYYNDKYFGDKSHLNAKGKKIFTDYIQTLYFQNN